MRRRSELISRSFLSARGETHRGGEVLCRRWAMPLRCAKRRIERKDSAGMTDLPDPEAFGDDGKQILERFRHFARNHVDDFRAARDRVRDLLAPSQPYLTGIAREDLLRHFLRKILPQGIAVD